MLLFLPYKKKGMKTKHWATTLVLACLLCTGCASAQKQPLVVITTDYGEIRLKLYDETPLHRDNFLKLAGEGFYDGVLFHRVINHFMIQGGDPASKAAKPGERLGNGGPGYTIPAEFVPGLVHKKGALAAARLGDQANPLKASSGSQFYIVHGKVWRPGELDTLEMQTNRGLRQNILRTVFSPFQEEMNRFRQENNQDALNRKVTELQARVDSLYEAAPKTRFTEQQRQLYTTVGGSPHLDGGYTVFGEVVEGLEVIDKIAAVKTDQSNRPLQDIRMNIKVIR